MIDDDEFAAWFRLLHTPGLGRSGARAVLTECGSPEAALQALQAQPGRWIRCAGRGANTAVEASAGDIDTGLARALAWRREAPHQRHVLTLGDPDYPATLLQTPDPPLWLFVQGDVQALSRRSVAIVGSRRPTPQGLDHARRFARELAESGWAVVSGLAQGIDGAAHEGALAGGGATVAVTGTGPDRVYPARHRPLAQRIAAQGAVVTEFPPGTPPRAEHFPQRNRLIAGLSRGTLVVEAALASGSLISARLALEASREVMAVPGSIDSPQSQGCHALIKQGAQLVESLDDILAALGEPTPASTPGTPSAALPGDPTPGSDPVLQALGHEPVSLDGLAARTGLDAAALQARLLDLELAGQVARLPGARFQRRARG